MSMTSTGVPIVRGGRGGKGPSGRAARLRKRDAGVHGRDEHALTASDLSRLARRLVRTGHASSNVLDPDVRRRPDDESRGPATVDIDGYTVRRWADGSAKCFSCSSRRCVHAVAAARPAAAQPTSPPTPATIYERTLRQ